MKKGIKDFEYLVGMPISTLTKEKVDELRRQHDMKQAELTALKKKTPQRMWLDDLTELEAVLSDRDAKMEEDERKERQKIAAAKAKQDAKRGAANKRGTKRSASEPPPPRRKGSSDTVVDGARATKRKGA